MKTSAPMRIWFIFFGLVILLGIFLTGFTRVHWLLYLPVAGLFFAGITGFCPSQFVIFKASGTKTNPITLTKES